MLAEKFSRYEIKQELGHGGMAHVYRAYDPLFEREVALKILKKELLNEPEVRESFERETKIIAKLQHGAIVSMYDFGKNEDEQLFFVMRYMAGGSLAERILHRSLSLAEIAHVLQRVSTALDYAHERGVIHRDIKPGNILFDEDNNAYISDFGIAKLTHAATRLTDTEIIGTPTHMSPEQARGEDVDRRSDIYSLGVILFEMLTGKVPYDASTPLGMAFRHANDPIPRIRDINPNLPVGMQTVMDKAMAKNRELRYRSGAEFTEAFVKTLSEPLPAEVNLATSSSIRVKTIDEPPTEPIPGAADKQPSLSRYWVYGGLIVLTLAALVTFLLRGHP